MPKPRGHPRPATALDRRAINQRLAASERMPTASWVPGDASRLAKEILHKNATR